MDSHSLIAIIGGAVGLFGGIAGILSWFNQRKQTAATEGQLAVMREQLQATKTQEETAIDWARKFDEAVKAVGKVSPTDLTIAPGKTTQAYSSVFDNQDLRRRVETYLGQRSWWSHKFIPVIPTKEQLQNPMVQRTISEVLDAVEQFRHDHTDFARTLKLV